MGKKLTASEKAKLFASIIDLIAKTIGLLAVVIAILK